MMFRLLLFVGAVLTSCQSNGSETWSSEPGCDIRDEGRALFGFPVDIGNITDKTDFISSADLAHSRLSDHVLYFINDNTNRNTAIFAVNARTAEIIGSINVTDATNEDWEAIAVGRCPSDLGSIESCIYIQDAGSKSENKNVIYVVREEDDPYRHVNKKADKIIRYNFQQGIRISQSKGLFVDCDGNIFFFDDVVRGVGTRLFKIPTEDVSTALVTLQTDLPTTNKGPVALSLSRDCRELLVKNEDTVYLIPVENGKLQVKDLQPQPILPHYEEEGIAWDPSGEKYFIVSESPPYTLKVAYRNESIQKNRFGLGKVAGIIDNKVLDRIVGMAGSRLHDGIAYAVSEFFDKMIIIKTFPTQIVGNIKIGIHDVIVTDMSTGSCQGGGKYCIYVNVQTFPFGNRMYIFEEPDNAYAAQTQSPISSTDYTVPDGFGYAIMIGPDKEIFVFTLAETRKTLTVNQLIIGTSEVDITTIAVLPNPSISDGPLAADISPCSNEIIVKFDDVILLWKVANQNFGEALKSEPSFLPYIPEKGIGSSVAFLDCDTYLTTSKEPNPVPLLSYKRG